MKTLSSYEIAGLPYGVDNGNTTPIELAVQAGQEVLRVIHDVKPITPSRFGTNEDDDYTGWIWLGGKRTPVETAYWGGALIWRLADDEPKSEVAS